MIEEDFLNCYFSGDSLMVASQFGYSHNAILSEIREITSNYRTARKFYHSGLCHIGRRGERTSVIEMTWQGFFILVSVLDGQEAAKVSEMITDYVQCRFEELSKVSGQEAFRAIDMYATLLEIIVDRKETKDMEVDDFVRKALRNAFDGSDKEEMPF